MNVLPRGLLGGESETPSCTDREKVVALFPLTRGSCSSLLPLSISWAQWFTLPSEQASREYGLSLCHLLGKQPLCEQASREHGLSLCPLLGKQPLLNFRKCRFFIRTIVLNANFLVYFKLPKMSFFHKNYCTEREFPCLHLEYLCLHSKWKGMHVF